MNRVVFLFSVIISISFQLSAQDRYDSLRREVLEMKTYVKQIDMRMQKSQKKFQTGILVSTIGYSVTIAGGMMLGRKNDQIGQGLLIAGGATGAIGTYFLLDAFTELGGRKKKKRK